MTVSESIIKWLHEFDLEEYGRLKQINTDIQGATVDTYALVKEPIKNVKTYLSGRKEITEHYAITARLASREDRERVHNMGFGEALEEWVTDQNTAEHYPEIPGARVKKISVTTPFFLGTTQTNDSVYQMTVQIKYEKGN